MRAKIIFHAEGQKVERTYTLDDDLTEAEAYDALVDAALADDIAPIPPEVFFTYTFWQD